MEYDFGHGHKELYATQPKEPGRAKEASDWYRVNPHRLHLGIIGLELENEVRPLGCAKHTAITGYVERYHQQPVHPQRNSLPHSDSLPSGA